VLQQTTKSIADISLCALQKTLNACGPLLINKEYLDLASASARGPQGGRGACLRNPDLETRAADVWDLVQSDQ